MMQQTVLQPQQYQMADVPRTGVGISNQGMMSGFSTGANVLTPQPFAIPAGVMMPSNFQV